MELCGTIEWMNLDAPAIAVHFCFYCYDTFNLSQEGHKFIIRFNGFDEIQWKFHRRILQSFFQHF